MFVFYLLKQEQRGVLPVETLGIQAQKWQQQQCFQF
jgi:hypothetical protein